MSSPKAGRVCEENPELVWIAIYTYPLQLKLSMSHSFSQRLCTYRVLCSLVLTDGRVKNSKINSSTTTIETQCSKDIEDGMTFLNFELDRFRTLEVGILLFHEQSFRQRFRQLKYQADQNEV